MFYLHVCTQFACLLDFLKLGLQMVVWELGIEPRSSEGATNTLNYKAPAPVLCVSEDHIPLQCMCEKIGEILPSPEKDKNLPFLF